MKQRITFEQMKSLNNRQKINLYCLLTEVERERLTNATYSANVYLNVNFEELTISKMIDILSNYKQIEITQGRVWWVTFIDNSLTVNSNELCDALWEAIKYIVEVEEEL